MFEILAPLLQIATDNASQALPVINIPATLTPVFTPPVADQGASLASAVDPLSATGIAGIIWSLYNTWQNMKNTGRANAIANSQLYISESLKATDGGVRDLAMVTSATVNQLAKEPENAKLLEQQVPELKGKSPLEMAKNQADGWNEDMKAYYQDTTPTPGEFSKDPIIAKTEAVKKLSTPSTSTS